MSKKETEFDRISRMRKLEREASVEKRKSLLDEGNSKKKGKPKSNEDFLGKHSLNNDYYDDEYKQI